MDTNAWELTASERGLARGIVLMMFLKIIVVQWIGLNAEAWYVWPWSWVAFAMMLPWCVELVNECRTDGSN